MCVAWCVVWQWIREQCQWAIHLQGAHITVCGDRASRPSWPFVQYNTQLLGGVQPCTRTVGKLQALPVVRDLDLRLLPPPPPLLPQNPFLPRCWWTPGLPAEQQSLKAHQLGGVQFMWNCLVVEHTAPPPPAAAAAGTSSGAAGQQQQQQNGNAGQLSDSDDDFMPAAGAVGSGDGSRQQEAIYIDDAGGCILAHSMGEREQGGGCAQQRQEREQAAEYMQEIVL